jgi:signal transduction histidine kinase
VVTDLTRMLSGFLGADIELNVQLDPHAGRVRADRGQLEQVIVNLALNARYAMRSGGRLTLGTSRTMLEDGYSRRHPGINIEHGPYVALSVTDTGPGMDAATPAWGSPLPTASSSNQAATSGCTASRGREPW